jgi:hypothetical protein
MKNAAGCLVLLLALSACGNGGSTPDAGESAPASSGPSALGACTPGDAAITKARTLLTLDLDGDGVAEGVRLSAGAPCPGVVYAETRSGTVLGEFDPMILSGEVRAVGLPEEPAQLLAATETHPRGGFQVHLIGLRGTRIVELLHDGAPLVPFVATDVPGPGTSTRCHSPGTFVVRTATPAGQGERVVVRDQRYRIDDGAVTAGEPRVLAKGLSYGEVARRFPDVAGNRMLQGCVS